MPASVSIEMAIEKNLIASTNPLLIALQVDVIDPETHLLVETLYLVRNNEQITYDGNIYGPVDFDIDVKHSAGEMPSVSLKVVDYTQVVQQKMQEYGGGVGFNVRMLVINGGTMNAAPELIEHYVITHANAQNYEVSWTVGANNPGNQRLPRRKQNRDRCSWRYKSAECGYTGSKPSCDLSLQGVNGCSVHNNEINYGGFPGLQNSG